MGASPSRTGRRAVHGVLPSEEQMLAALRGHYLLGPLCRKAFDLAELHRRRREGPEGAEQIDTLRTALVDEIDDWASRVLPAPRPDARRVSESLGRTVDRLAEASALAFHLLMTVEPSSDQMHRAWTRLAELGIAYGELSFGLSIGSRRLPSR